MGKTARDLGAVNSRISPSFAGLSSNSGLRLDETEATLALFRLWIEVRASRTRGEASVTTFMGRENRFCVRLRPEHTADRAQSVRNHAPTEFHSAFLQQFSGRFASVDGFC
jgi:hypothetical protein